MFIIHDQYFNPYFLDFPSSQAKPTNPDCRNLHNLLKTKTGEIGMA